MNPYIIDTTLRDGEQAPGVVFSIDEKLRIAELLNQLGVDEVEAGTPAIGLEESTAIKEVANGGFKFRTSCWTRANLNDIDEAAKLGTDSINISLPVSNLQIKTINKNRRWVISQLKKVVLVAKYNFKHVTIGAQDASRADRKFLNEFIFYAGHIGVDRIRIADTVGSMDPLEVNRLFLELSDKFSGMEFEFHGHNDLGLATANAVTALESGARCVSATVNGLGERAGNSVLEEVIANLVKRHKICHYNTRVINELCDVVAKASHVILPENKPLVGKKTFTHESGIHVSSLIKDRKTYQELDPIEYGLEGEGFVYGKHSGKAAIMHFFEEMNMEINDFVAQKILSKVKELTKLRKSGVLKEDLLKIYQLHI
jgi:homocitrate synthase NifV